MRDAAVDPLAAHSAAGRLEAVLVHLCVPCIAPENLHRLGLDSIEDELISSIESAHVGEFDGNEMAVDGTEAILFAYGPHADPLFAAIEPVLRRHPLAVGARVVVRYGEPGARERFVDLPGARRTRGPGAVQRPRLRVR